jgi:putative ABC transport system permease protein
VTLASLALRNLARHKVRSGLTVLAFAIAVLAFVLARTVVAAWSAAEDSAAADRLATRNRVSFTLVLPRSYIDVVRAVPGVQAATFANWFQGRDPHDPRHVFTSLAVDAASYLDVFPEIHLAADARARWLADKQGVVLGAELAARLGVTDGDTLVLSGTIYPGEWRFHVAGRFTTDARAPSRRHLLLRWDYLDDSVPAWRRGRLGWIVSRLAPAASAAVVGRAIDAGFASHDVRTLTMSERAVQQSFRGMLAALLSALDAASAALLAIMALILGNAIAMGVRERTAEYAVLAAIGFRPRQLAGLVLGEAVALAAAGALVGLALAEVLVDRLLGGWIADHLSGFFPWFHTTPAVMLAALGLALAIGAVAGLVPAWRAGRLAVADALRRVDE